MENDKIFNRLSGFFDQEIEKVNDLKGKLREDAAAIAHQASERLKHSGDSIRAAEESVVRTLREYQTTFVIAGVTVLGLMIVASVLFRRAPHRGE